jgi:hypothetical protein
MARPGCLDYFCGPEVDLEGELECTMCGTSSAREEVLKTDFETLPYLCEPCLNIYLKDFNHETQPE